MAGLCVLLASACFYDYGRNRIPNFLAVLTAGWGGMWRLLDGGPPGVLFYLGEAVLVMAFLYPFFKISAVGAGDVKLFGVTAGYLPFDKVLIFLFVSLLIAATFSLVKMCKENNFILRMRCLSRYLGEVIKGGSWRRYPGYGSEGRRAGIRLSGPVFFSILLYLGGAY